MGRGLAVAGGAGVAGRAVGAERERLAVRVGKVVTRDGADSVINNAVVLVADGKIERVGSAGQIAIPDGYRLIDKPDHWLVPGLVDAHNHAAGSGRPWRRAVPLRLSVDGCPPADPRRHRYFGSAQHRPGAAV